MAKDFVNSNSIESLLWAALWIFILLALPSVIAYISLGVYNFYKKRILSVLYETDYYFTQEEGEEDSVGEGK